MYSPWVKKFLAPPVFEDEDKTRIAELLNIILLTVLVIAVMYGLFSPIIHPNPAPVLAIISVEVILLLGLRALMRRGQVQLVSLLILLVLWAIYTLAAIVSGGVRTPAFSSYMSVILIAGLLLGGRGGIGFAGLCALAGLGLLYAETSELLPPSLFPTTPVAMWAGLAANFIMAAVLLHLATRSIGDALERARRSETRARKAQAQLVDAIESLTEAFALYDADDHLVLCNSKYREFYDLSADLLIPGTRFEDHIRASAYRGQIAEAVGREEAWVQEQVKQHQNPQRVYLQQLGNGRWLQISERKTGEGGIIGVRTDITERVRAEAALRESEVRYRTLVEQASDGIFIADAQGRYIDVNMSGCQMLGYSRQEILQQSITDLVPAENRTAVPLRFDELVAGKSIISERRLKCKDGALLPVEISAKMLPDGRLLGIMRDIADRKQAEEMATRFGRILDASLNEIYIFDAATLHFIQVNRGARENLGYSMAELRHLTPLDLKPEFTPESFAKLLEPLRTGEKDKIQFTTIHRRKDHSSYPVEVHLQLSTFETAPVFLAIILDITERKRAEEALERSEQHFRSLIENALDIITILNSDGIIRYESPAIERVLGYKPEELVGQDVFDFVHSTDLPDVMKTFTERSQIVGPAPPIELRFQHKDGSWRILEVIGTNLLDDPDVAGIVVNSRDITERRQLEEQFRQAQRMEAIGQLTAGIAHDFNNLLTAINGFAGLMQLELPPDDPQQESVDKILHSGRRAADLVRQLLAFSRKQVIEPRILNLNTTVAEMDKLLRRTIGEDIDLETSLDPDLWWVKVDPTQMGQIIVNLAVNARDAMPYGGRLTIETTNVVLDDDYTARHLGVEQGEYVLLAISDTGHGMSDEVKARIFEPFFTTKEMGKGTGLGLATVFGIVKQSQGYIWVYSEEGVGTTFKIYLPREGEATSRLTDSKVGLEMLFGDETILLVEDDAAVRDLIVKVLQEQGYTLLEAQGGQEALRLATQNTNPIHLLLTDVIMPGMSGTILAEELVKSRPNLKVLFMSGYTDNAIAHYGVLDSEINFLQKPFSPTALARRVRDVLDS